ncbi:protein YhfH [Brevibacillus sp. H7]|jgi:predicted  nucleic acid-binding Zn-ribbon protein|uniref:protein YhfH n=1 Tax=Brevibacillus sp. H7 TaxID=3349138 RepID=UPI00382B34BC
MTPVTTFFQNLEAKCCTQCGNAMTEQAESYLNECIPCQEKQFSEYLAYAKKR